MQFLRPIAGVLMAILALHSLAAYFIPRLRPIPRYPPLIWLLRGVGTGIGVGAVQGTYVNELAILISCVRGGDCVEDCFAPAGRRELF